MIHLLTEVKAGVVSSGCGLEHKDLKTTAWFSEVTCPICTTRLLVHRRVSKEDIVALITDLENNSRVQLFSFTGKRWKFKWLINEPLIYVFEDAGSAYASYAIHIADSDCTYENAQVAAKMHILTFESNNGKDTVALKPKVRRVAPVKVEPTDPHCDLCWKLDEGDCVESPADETKIRCMTCFIKETMK